MNTSNKDTNEEIYRNLGIWIYSGESKDCAPAHAARGDNTGNRWPTGLTETHTRSTRIRRSKDLALTYAGVRCAKALTLAFIEFRWAKALTLTYTELGWTTQESQHIQGLDRRRPSQKTLTGLNTCDKDSYAGEAVSEPGASHTHLSVGSGVYRKQPKKRPSAHWLERPLDLISKKMLSWRLLGSFIIATCYLFSHPAALWRTSFFFAKSFFTLVILFLHMYKYKIKRRYACVHLSENVR